MRASGAVVGALLAGLALGPASAAAFTTNLDRDAPREEVVLRKATTRYASPPFTPTRWIVRDRVMGRRIFRALTPPSDRHLPPKLGDRNANGLREILFSSASGNSIFDTRIVEWSGRRARTLWVLPTSSSFWRRALPAGANLAGTTAPRFPVAESGAARDLLIDAFDAPCRACEPEEVYTVRFGWSPARGKWVFADVVPASEAAHVATEERGHRKPAPRPAMETR